MSQNIKNRYALITGASSGIGQAIAMQLSLEGWKIINFDRQPPEHQIGQYIKVDVSDKDELAHALALVACNPNLIGLVNNVGLVRPASLDTTKLDDFDYHMAINARASLQCVQALLANMRHMRFGRIVNITSRAALGKELRSAYAASKGALTSMTRTWALELGADQITVNAVAPGPIGTAAFKIANPPGSPLTRRIIDSVPLRHIGEPQDVAKAVSFFMREETKFITGQTLNVCGGITVGLSP